MLCTLSIRFSAPALSRTLNPPHTCAASTGEWRRARESYLAAAEGFQRASGFRYGRSTTPRLDGAVFAASNAALMLAQLGDEEGAVREMQAIARWVQGWRLSCLGGCGLS